ncbi:MULTISPECIES: hypothetical protein [unclassified Paenibacillus]|uniref:hypothetical protein n=1 Tax=unclassified Paenibacillus TaxID=185978 RepID=UPI00362CAC24
MAQGVVDVYVSKDQSENSLMLIANCGGGLPNDLHLIRDGAKVTLKRGDIEKSIVVNHEIGAECAFNYIEMDTNTAKTFGLQDGNRVLLNYDSESRNLQIQRLTKSRANGLLRPDPRKTRTGAIIIGYSLLSLLGIPHKPGTSITLRLNSVSQKMKVLIPSNELDSDLRLAPSTLRKFGLVPGKFLTLEYDQISKTLSVLNTSAIASKQRKSTRIKPMKAIKPAMMEKPVKASGAPMKMKNVGKSIAQKISKKSNSVKIPGALAILAKKNRMGTLKTLTKNRKR